MIRSCVERIAGQDQQICSGIVCCVEFCREDSLSNSSFLGVLDVLHCVLVDSPEALNVIKEQHIRTIISLIDKHGRDPKV